MSYQEKEKDKGMINMIEKKEKVVKQCINKEINAQQAAVLLDLSVRQVERLKAKMREGFSLVHGNCGRVSKKAISAEKEGRILEEYGKYKDKMLNFKHFKEILAMDCGIEISYTSLTTLLNRNGILSPKQHRKKKKKQHLTRERRDFFGELIQLDGTSYDWFGDGVMWCLHVMIDDNRGVITGLYMTKNECKQGYFECLSQMFENYGLPKALYGDGLKFIFGDGKKEPTIEEQLAGIEVAQTQFAKDMKSLGISLIHAHSPQAKGRVERMNGTLQGRLVAEFHRYGIKSPKQANEFFKWWLPKHNARFGVNPDSKSVFTPMPNCIDLDYVLSHKETRKVDNGGVFSLNGYQFQALGLCNCKIDVIINKNFGLKAYFKSKYYDILPLTSGNMKITQTLSVRAIIDKFVACFTLADEHSA